MSYDNPYAQRMVFPSFDFGADANEIMSFRGPPGKKGRIIMAGLMVTETFACDSTTAKVRVGTAADNDAYVELIINDAVADEDFWDSNSDDTDAIKDDDIPADQLVEVNFIQSVDGSGDAGQGIFVLDVLWY